LRVHPAEGCAQRAVLAGGVEPLEDDEKRAGSLGLKGLLEVPETAPMLLEEPLGHGLGEHG